MSGNRSLRLMGVLAVLAASSSGAEADVVYSDTVLARGPEYGSTTQLALSGQGSYQITATDLHWLDAPLSALSFGAFTATGAIETKVGAGALEFFYAGQGTVFLQLYARTALGKSAGLIGLEVTSVAAVALPASLWLLLSALTAAGFWGWLQRRAAELTRPVADQVGPMIPQPVPAFAISRSIAEQAGSMVPQPARAFAVSRSVAEQAGSMTPRPAPALAA